MTRVHIRLKKADAMGRKADRGHALLTHFANMYRGGNIDLGVKVSSVYSQDYIKETPPEPDEKAIRVHDIVAKMRSRDREVIFAYYMPSDDNFPHVEAIAGRFKVTRRTLQRWLYDLRLIVAEKYTKQ